MLVLSRKKGESIVIGNNIEITILSVEGENVRIGVSAPKEIDIFRKEVFEAIQLNNQNAIIHAGELKDVLTQFSKIKNDK
jgi:carbon storage regulator